MTKRRKPHSMRVRGMGAFKQCSTWNMKKKRGRNETSVRAFTYTCAVIHITRKKMATLESPMGRYNQSIGGVTYSNWKGVQVAKQKVPSRNSSNSPAQQLQRARFAYLATYARLFGPAIRVGFREAAQKRTEQNVFTAYNSQFVQMVNGMPQITFANLRISQGTLPGVAGLSATVNNAQTGLVVTWDNNSDGAFALATDKIYIAATATDGGITVLSLGTVARSATTVTVSGDFSQIPGGTDIAVYAFFKSATSTKCSETAYFNASA